MTKQIDIGDDFPLMNLPRDGGENVNLADHKGKWMVFYFYPKDMTPGCTTESQDFRDLKDQFAAAGAEIFGVSRDSVKRHDKFVEKEALNFALLSDEDGALCEAVGSWVEKSMYGRKYMGIDRSTFLVGPDGKVKALWRKVKVTGHAAEVLAQLKQLSS